MSPIQGLTEVRRLPRLGKIRMGVKVPRKTKDGRDIEVPQKTDYFVVPPEIAKIYGEKPKSLDILIPVEDEEKWAPQYYKLYSLTQGLVCRGDGCAAIRLIDTMTGDRAHRDTKEVVKKEMTCPGRKCPDYIARDGCKEVMSLQFILYKVPGFGIWQIDTSSINSIININSCADYIRAMFGKVAMIPLQLTIEPKQVQLPDSGKKQTVYVLNLRNNMTLLDMIESTKKFQAQLPSGARLALPPADEDTVEAGELAEDGQEPDDPEMVESKTVPVDQVVEGKVAGEILDQEALETRDETETSDIAFDKLESAVSTFDVDWAVSAISKAQKKGILTRDELSEIINTRFLPAGSVLEKPSIKALIPLLSQDKLTEFAKWIQELEARS